jgi:hypothetical protein
MRAADLAVDLTIRDCSRDLKNGFYPLCERTVRVDESFSNREDLWRQKTKSANIRLALVRQAKAVDIAVWSARLWKSRPTSTVFVHTQTARAKSHNYSQ